VAGGRRDASEEDTPPMMRKTLIKTLDGVRRGQKLWMKLRGRTPEGVAEQRIVSGDAWEEFCDTLKAAGASLKFPGTPQDPFNQAEGYRYLSRLVRAGLEGFLEDADPRAPTLKRVVHETVKMGADNPDNYYQNASISGAYEYRIRGHRGTVSYLAFGTQAGHYGQGGGMPPTGFLEASRLQIDANGHFEITLSCDERPGNWLRMTPETGLLIVRQTFLDRSKETLAQLQVERVDGPGQPGPITPAMVDDGLRNASTLVAGASLLFSKWARDFQKHSNQLPQFDAEVSNRAGGDPNIAYYHSHWQLGPDEALVIDVVPPRCEHWNFQLNNYWMESLDYRYFTIHKNKHSAATRPDGSVRLVVAHRDPGVANWIQTVGHECGTMCFRWVRADAHPVPRTRVVKHAELAAL
jgi:hypothetical protein